MIKIKKNYYKFNFDTYNKLWTTVKRALGENYQRKTSSEIFFKSKNAVSLEKFMKKRERINYDTACSFFSSIANQLLDLEKYNLTVPFFEIKDFVVISDDAGTRFIYINNDKLLPIKDNFVIIDQPYKKNTFFHQNSIVVHHYLVKYHLNRDSLV